MFIDSGHRTKNVCCSLHAENQFITLAFIFDELAVHKNVHKNEFTAGMAQWDPSLSRLRQVIVDENYRGRGVASKLVGLVFQEARQDGKNIVLVHALQDSKLFYRRLGFTETGPPYASGDKGKGVTCQKMQASTVANID